MLRRRVQLSDEILRIECSGGMDQIPYGEVRFHPHSYGDPAGRLFSWRGQLYRGISHEATQFFLNLLQSGTTGDLTRAGLLIDTELTDLSLAGYGMVVRHRPITFLSYPQEWCAPMFRDAALAYIDLLAALARCRLTLKDTHPWNLTFDRSQPVFLDFTSIKPLSHDGGYQGYDKFRRYYLYPLVLMSRGHERLVRHLLLDPDGISASDLSILCRRTVPIGWKSSAGEGLHSGWSKHAAGCRQRLERSFRSVQWLLADDRGSTERLSTDLSRLRRDVESVPLRNLDLQPSAQCSGAPGPTPTQSPFNAEDITNAINGLRPGSILIIGNEMKQYSQSAAAAGTPVVFFDTKSSCVTRIYHEARAKRWPLLPLVMDFADPTPSRGLSSHVSIAATERFQCDIVVALGLVRRLISQRHLRFHHIVDGLAQFSKQWVLVDFAPPASETQSWDTMANFITALKEQFPRVTPLSVAAQQNPLFLCEK